MNATLEADVELLVDEAPKPKVNAQLYLKSALNGSDAETSYQANPEKLEGTRVPNFAITHEKPEHRVILFLKAQGLSNREVARRTGYTDSWISQVTRQPWFLQRLLEVIKEEGREAVTEMIKVSAADSVITLLEIRDDVNAPKAVRASVCNTLLDRLLGRASQTVTINKEGGLAKRETENISKELEEIGRQEVLLMQQLQGANG